MRVFDHNRHLGKHRLIADVQILHRVRSEISLLEHFNRLFSHPAGKQESLVGKEGGLPVGLDRQKTLAGFGRVEHQTHRLVN